MTHSLWVYPVQGPLSFLCDTGHCFNSIEKPLPKKIKTETKTFYLVLYSERKAVKSFPVLANAETLWNVKWSGRKELTFQLSLQYRFQSANCTSLNEYSKKKERFRI